MEIKVHEQPKRFQLAMNGWVGAIGHEINVGEYSFCAIPTGDFINVSEVTTGLRMFNVQITDDIASKTETKEKANQYFYTLGDKLKTMIERSEDFKGHLELWRRYTRKRFGEQPEIYAVNIDYITE